MSSERHGGKPFGTPESTCDAQADSHGNTSTEHVEQGTTKERGKHQRMDIILLLVVAMLVGVVSVIVHELGHVTLARLVGWKAIGFFAFSRVFRLQRASKTRRRSTRRPAALQPLDPIEDLQQGRPPAAGGITWGAAAVFPQNHHDRVSWHYVAVLAGGPAFSFFLSVGLVIVGLFLGQLDVGILAIVPLGVTIGSLLPLRSGLSGTDGLRLRELIKGGDAATAERLRFDVSAALAHGVYPRLSQEQSDILIRSDFPVVRYLGLAVSLYWAQRGGDSETTERVESMLSELFAGERIVREWDPLSLRSEC